MPPKRQRTEEDGDKTAKDAIATKCSKCKTRPPKKGCTQTCCLNCCTDNVCESHAESKVRAKYNQQLLSGDTEIGRQAKRQRQLAILPGSFREPGFAFTEQSIKIWDIREYMSNPKWKEDAIRRSEKRQSLIMSSSSQQKPRILNSKKRFRKLVEQWYQESLVRDDDCNNGDKEKAMA